MGRKPWNRIDPDRLRVALSAAWGDPIPVNGGRGRIYFAKLPVRLSDLLLEGFPPNTVSEEMLEEYADEGLDVIGGMEKLFAWLDGCRATNVSRSTVVSCWVETMGGGCWELLTLEAHNRGYIVYTLDEDGEECSPAHVCAMWEPAADASVRREAVIRTYVANWSDLVLPPEMGQCATGRQPLWMECLLALLDAQPSLWPVLASQMPRGEFVDDGCWKYVASLAKLPEKRLLELYADAGFRLRVQRTGEGRKRARTVVHESAPERNGLDDDDDEESDEVQGWWLMASAAPFDRDTARFFVANYCWVLANVPGMDRDV
jgi:hypothetical protein